MAGTKINNWLRTAKIIIRTQYNKKKYLVKNSENTREYTVLANKESNDVSEISNSRIHNIHHIPTREELDKKITPLLPTYFHTRQIQQIAEIMEYLDILLTTAFNLPQLH